MSFSSCYYLVFHGSSDPRSQAAADVLTEEFRQKLSHRSAVPQALGTTLSQMGSENVASNPGSTSVKQLSDREEPFTQAVYLECHPLPLHQQVKDGIDQVQAIAPPALRSSTHCTLLPVFLLQGVHVMEDIPAELALVQQLLGSNVEITLTSHLGSHSGLRRIITEQMASIPVEVWVLVAHGSRRPGANESLEALAAALGAVVAYWSMPPNLESCLTELMQQGFTRIGIAPFFLFPGGITDAIATTVNQLSLQAPTVKLSLLDPLGVYPGLADLLLDLLPKECSG